MTASLDHPLASTLNPSRNPPQDHPQNFPRWHCVGASVMGVSHQRNATPCQDMFGYCHLPTGELVVAVADGAGSAPLAKEGAQMVVEGALAAVTGRWGYYRPASRKAWRELVYHAFQTAQQGVFSHAVNANQPPRAYAATLLVAIISQDLVACGLVGDCAIVVATDEGAMQSLCQAQRGPYANTTYFATHHDLKQQLDVQLWEGSARHVALLTDGLLSLALNIDQNRPYAPFFDPLFGFVADVGNTVDEEAVAVQALTTFLDSERVNQRTHDDKTLVLVGQVDR